MPLSEHDEEELRIHLQRLSRRIRNERGANISDTQLGALWHLRNDGPLSPSVLAERERVSPPSMNRTVNCLEESGLARRDPSPHDARKVLVSITDAGEDLIRETVRLRSAWFHDRLAELEPAERHALGEVLPILRRLSES